MQSLTRAFQLLELMASNGGSMALSELSHQSGLPLPTTYRVVNSMVSEGYVRRLQERGYALGPRLIGLGAVASRMLGACADPFIEELVEAVGETAGVAALDGESAAYIAQAPSRFAMRMSIEVGHRSPLHCTAAGKVILAQLPPSQVKHLLARTELQRYTPRTISSFPELKEELATVAKQGFAVDDGESEKGLRSIAVSVPEAPVPMALSVLGPDSRLTIDTVTAIVPLLHSTAAKLMTCV
ncbi:IclR family transcriptional regulator [Georgenia yuyongxinii]|uniref:IclR family transcriptional regulator n=2 Tax=Georgenia yuyongxinii TaxID=2589797 RepID=A0A5B8C8N5_9MICO|nr:IclR family transcriptional regulator [Georgenia yuyongxinii]